MALNVLEERALAELDLSHERPFRLADHLSSVRAASAVVVLLLWEIFGRQINPLFLSYPSAIARALLQLLNAGEIQRQAMGSLQVFAVGLSGALVLGIIVGLLMGRYRLAEYLLDPYVYALDATPRVALIPLLLLWFGLGTSSKIAIVFLSGLFPVLMNTFSGVRTVSAHLVDTGLWRPTNFSSRLSFWLCWAWGSAAAWRSCKSASRRGRKRRERSNSMEPPRLTWARGLRLSNAKLVAVSSIGEKKICQTNQDVRER